MFQMKSAKWKTILLHISFWLIIFSYPFILHPDLLSNDTSALLSLFFYGLRYIALIGLFYLNAYVLIPELLYRKKYLTYIFTQLLSIAALSAIHIIFTKFFLSHSHIHYIPVGFTIFTYIFIWACSTAYQMLRHKIKTDKLSNEKERENLKTELSFLRSQVSPHFMFNVLNNMVSLARKRSDQLEPSLIKLSSLLRYMIYETDEEKKPLEKEIEYLQSFIDLQQQRFGNNIRINTSLQTENIDYDIEPMILIPFVENAFKHGVVWEDDAHIDIELTVRNGMLSFFVKNKYDNSTQESKDKTSGIGLNNVKRRLQLLYDDKHVLHIDKIDGWFTVSLQLNLK